MYAEERLRERTCRQVAIILLVCWGRVGVKQVPRQQNSAVFFTYLGPWAGSKKPAFPPFNLGEIKKS
jgi:hypothetical protein